jgi:hypothetical protein
VALKAINFDGCVNMAALAKIASLGVDALIGLAGMASHAFLERVLAGTDAAVHGVIALMLE